MKKLIFVLIATLFLGACFLYLSEDVIGYNEEGKAVVKICRSRGTVGHERLLGASCRIELRDYGKVSPTTEEEPEQLSNEQIMLLLEQIN